MNNVREVGFWIRALAVLHAAVGIAIFRGPLLEIARSGGFNSVDVDAGRQTAFWFLIFSPLLYLTGRLATQARIQTGTYPPELIRPLLWICAVGTFLMPVSGFPAGLVVCLLALRQTRALPRAAQA